MKKVTFNLYMDKEEGEFNLARNDKVKSSTGNNP